MRERWRTASGHCGRASGFWNRLSEGSPPTALRRLSLAAAGVEDHVILQAVGQIGHQVRAPQEQERETGVNGRVVVVLPAAVGGLPLEDLLRPPAIPVGLAELLALVQH